MGKKYPDLYYRVRDKDAIESLRVATEAYLASGSASVKDSVYLLNELQRIHTMQEQWAQYRASRAQAKLDKIQRQIYLPVTEEEHIRRLNQTRRAKIARQNEDRNDYQRPSGIDLSDDPDDEG